MYIFYRDGTFYTLTGVIYPYVEQNSQLELVLNVLYQTIASLIALISLPVLQGSSAIFSDTVNVSTEINIYELKKLSIDLERSILKIVEIRNRLNHICKQIQKTDEYEYI